MSIEATLATWKLTKNQVTSTEKLFLLSCANRAGETHECWPGIERLSKDTGLDRKTIIKIRQSLIDKGLMAYTGQYEGHSKKIPVMRLIYVKRLDEILNSTNFGTVPIFPGDSTNFGTEDSTNFGIQNLKEESKRESKNIYIRDSEKSANLSYTDFCENEKSDYGDNCKDQQDIEVQLVDGNINSTKSDYCDNKTKKVSIRKDKVQFSLNDMLENNPYGIPEQAIGDWITTRGKNVITKTAWNLVNNQLKKCIEEGIDPIEAFETMVASNWKSMKVDYFLSKEKISKKEEAKRRSIELEEMAAKRKQKEIDDANRINRIPSNLLENEISKMKKKLVGAPISIRRINNGELL